MFTCGSNNLLIYLQFCWVSRPTILITFGAIFRMSRLWATLSGERPETSIWLVRYLNIPLFNMSIGNFHRRRKFIFSLLDGGFTIVSENIFTMAETFPGSFRTIREAKEPVDIARQLKAKNLTHLLVRDELLIRFLHDNLD